MLLPLAIVLGGFGVVAAWATWAARRDAREAAQPKQPAPQVAPEPIDRANPFAPPSSQEAAPSVFSQAAVALPTFFFSPLYGGTLSAWNWFRVGDRNRGAKAVGLGVAGYVALVVATAIPKPLGGVAVLIVAVAAMYVFHRDQGELHKAHPSVGTTHWVYAVAFGFGLLCFAFQFQQFVWILTGDDRLKAH